MGSINRLTLLLGQSRGSPGPTSSWNRPGTSESPTPFLPTLKETLTHSGSSGGDPSHSTSFFSYFLPVPTHTRPSPGEDRCLPGPTDPKTRTVTETTHWNKEGRDPEIKTDTLYSFNLICGRPTIGTVGRPPFLRTNPHTHTPPNVPRNPFEIKSSGNDPRPVVPFTFPVTRCHQWGMVDERVRSVPRPRNLRVRT